MQKQKIIKLPRDTLPITTVKGCQYDRVTIYGKKETINFKANTEVYANENKLAVFLQSVTGYELALYM